MSDLLTDQDVVEWMNHTKKVGNALAEHYRKEMGEFHKALNEAVHDNPVDKAILFFSLSDQWFFVRLLGFQPRLNENFELIGFCPIVIVPSMRGDQCRDGDSLQATRKGKTIIESIPLNTKRISQTGADEMRGVTGEESRTKPLSHARQILNLWCPKQHFSSLLKTIVGK